MPVTVPAHQAAVLPIKLAWPARVDGVALVVGSAAPDLTYAFMPWWPFGSSHDLVALAWWAMPVGVLLSLFIRWAVLPSAGHLPPLGVLRLRDYAASAGVRYRLRVSAASAFVGGATHVGWDYFTHAGGAAVLAGTSPLGVPWYQLGQYVSGVGGTVVALWCLVHIGRLRLLVHWHGPPPAAAGRAGVWWAAATVVGIPLAVTAVLLPEGTLPHILMARWIWAAVLAAGCAAVAVHPAFRRRDRQTS